MAQGLVGAQAGSHQQPESAPKVNAVLRVYDADSLHDG